MLADLDLLLTVVYCMADDFLPKPPGNAREDHRRRDRDTVRGTGDHGDPVRLSVRRGAGKRLRHLFPEIPTATRCTSAAIRLSGQIEALIAISRARAPGSSTICCWSTPPRLSAPLARTVKRGGQSSLADALTDAADYGYCASHSRHFFGFRLHALFAPDGTPRALALTSPKIDEKLVCLQTGRPLRTSARPSADPDRRQELPRQGLRDRTRQAGGDDHAPPPQGRARHADRTSPRSASGSSRSSKPARTSSRSSATAPVPFRPPRPPVRPLRSARRSRDAQPPTRPPPPHPRPYTA